MHCKPILGREMDGFSPVQLQKHTGFEALIRRQNALPKQSIRDQNSSRDHEFLKPVNQFEIIPERQVDANGHNLASDDAQGGPDSPKIAWH